MNPKRLFYHLSRVIMASIVHLFLAFYVYTVHPVLVIIGFILVTLNMAILIIYFVNALKLTLLRRTHEKDAYFVSNILLGVLVSPVILFVFFVIIYYYIGLLA
jgi:hypothetical protein